MITLTELNQLEGAGFVAVLGGVFEHSPWVAERASVAGPFGSLDELHRAMCAAMHEAGDEEKLVLIRKHPDLGDRLGALTDESATEQKAAGLDVLTEAEVAQFQRCNETYRSKFDFPFV
ncbi:MAG: 2-oxo-4-hydroxy-4-carboxy-5-ureidoimidazoline decarboxylase, partial [Verrucomicrobium sp.]